MSQTLKENKGFTLVEVMIVAAIIGIAGVIAVPSYIQWNARYVLRQSSKELVANLSLARMAAKSRNIPVTVTLTQTLCPPAISDCGRVTIQTGSFQTTPLDRAINGFTGGPVQFSPLGLLIGNANQVMTLRVATSTGPLVYSVVVTPNGKVNWCAQATLPCALQ